MARREQQIGRHGQTLAASTLSARGVLLVEEIGTPVRIIDTKNIRGVTWVRIVYGEKVAGDHHGLLSDGTGVLAECKTILDRNLRWSDLREHQPGKLDEYAAAGGCALLVWVHSSGVY